MYKYGERILVAFHENEFIPERTRIFICFTPEGDALCVEINQEQYFNTSRGFETCIWRFHKKLEVIETVHDPKDYIGKTVISNIGDAFLIITATKKEVYLAVPNTYGSAEAKINRHSYEDLKDCEIL